MQFVRRLQCCSFCQLTARTRMMVLMETFTAEVAMQGGSDLKELVSLEAKLLRGYYVTNCATATDFQDTA